MKLKMTDERRERLHKANEFIGIIGSHGRRFFYNEKTNHLATIHVKNGGLYLTDEKSGEHVYLHTSWLGRGFSHGGTLNQLIVAIKDFIVHDFKIHIDNFAPECNRWGYGEEALSAVASAALHLGISDPAVHGD